MSSPTRTQVVQALEVLGLDPASAEEVLILQDRIVVRRRDVVLIADDTDEPRGHEH